MYLLGSPGSISLARSVVVLLAAYSAESLAFRIRRGFLSKHEAIDVVSRMGWDGMGWMDDRGRLPACLGARSAFPPHVRIASSSTFLARPTDRHNIGADSD